METILTFEQEVQNRVRENGSNKRLRKAGDEFLVESVKAKYSYNFSWFGRPLIQYPQDIIAMQELIFRIRPDVIVETGIAHGGSLIFNASMLQLLGKGRVIGIDIDIRPHNRAEIEKSPFFHRIQLVQGSSIDREVFEKVKSSVASTDVVLVVLDSNHVHGHVLEELRLYSTLVRKGSYLVVFDTVIEYLPDSLNRDRPWGKGDSPYTAVQEFLAINDRFEVDEHIYNKLVVSVAPSGFLRCVRDEG
jgi:cephalosporin hydroxylase